MSWRQPGQSWASCIRLSTASLSSRLPQAHAVMSCNSQMVMTTMSCVSRVLWEPLLLELVDVSGPSMAQYRSQPVAGQVDTASWLWEQVTLPMPLAGQSVRLACREVGMENPLQPAVSAYPATWHSNCLGVCIASEFLQPRVTALALSEHGQFAFNSGRHDLSCIERPAGCICVCFTESSCHDGSQQVWARWPWQPHYLLSHAAHAIQCLKLCCCAGASCRLSKHGRHPTC